MEESQLIKKINLEAEFEKFSDYWNPRIAGELNGQQVKLAKFKGPFVWHHHEHEDELFLVIKGNFEMLLRDKTIQLFPGEFVIIPRGVEHCPSAEEEVWVLLFEPNSTLNTGNTNNELTKDKLERID